MRREAQLLQHPQLQLEPPLELVLSPTQPPLQLDPQLELVQVVPTQLPLRLDPPLESALSPTQPLLPPKPLLRIVPPLRRSRRPT